MLDETSAAIPAHLLDNVDRQEQNAGVAVAGRQRETHMGFARTLATILFIVALPVAVLTTNIRLLANVPLVYDYSFDRYNAEEVTGLSRADLDSTARALRTYFSNNESTFYQSVTDGGLAGPVFSARETRHMEDVKSLFLWVNRLQELSLMYVLGYGVVLFVWAKDGNIRQLAGQSLIGLLLGAFFVGGIGLTAAFGFDAAFARFHEVLFSNSDWQLDPRTDHLIQMFPEAFWRDMTLVLGAMCAIEAALVGGVSAVYLMGSRRDRPRASALDVSASRTQAA